MTLRHFVGGFRKDVDMNRIDLTLFDRVKRVFPSDRHELRRAAINFQSIKREYWDWKSELDLPKKYPTSEIDLCYLAVNTACQHFESSLDFAQGLEYMLAEKRANIIPAICILLRQSFESAITAHWICAESDVRNLAQRGYQVAIRDLNNKYNLAEQLYNFEPMHYNYKNLNVEKIADEKLKLLLIGNKLEFSSKLAKEIYAPLITRLFKNANIGGEKMNLTWAYMMLSAVGHGTWLGFYPSDKEFTYLINLKDLTLREGLNRLKARSTNLIELAG